MFHGPTPRTLGVALILTLRTFLTHQEHCYVGFSWFPEGRSMGMSFPWLEWQPQVPRKITLAKLLREGCRQCPALGDSDSQQVHVLCNEGSHSAGTALQVKITKLGLKK